jgi:hypothetical protein
MTACFVMGVWSRSEWSIFQGGRGAVWGRAARRAPSLAPLNRGCMFFLFEGASDGDGGPRERESHASHGGRLGGRRDLLRHSMTTLGSRPAERGRGEGGAGRGRTPVATGGTPRAGTCAAVFVRAPLRKCMHLYAGFSARCAQQGRRVASHQQRAGRPGPVRTWQAGRTGKGGLGVGGKANDRARRRPPLLFFFSNNG